MVNNNKHDEAIKPLSTNSKQIISTSFSIDGKLACGSIDGMLNIIDMNTQTIIDKMNIHNLSIRSMCFSDDGNILYTASDDRHVTIYDMKSASIITSFSHSGMCLSVDSSYNGRHFIVGCADNTVSLWDLGKFLLVILLLFLILL